MNTEKEWISLYLPKNLAIQVKGLEEGRTKEELVLKYIEESKDDIKVTLESFDEDVIMYKAQMISLRKKFEEAKNAELEANYKMWEQFDLEKVELKKKIGTAVSELKPLIEEFKLLKALINDINLYKIDDLTNSISKLSASMKDNEHVEILKFLFEKYNLNR